MNMPGFRYLMGYALLSWIVGIIYRNIKYWLGESDEPAKGINADIQQGSVVIINIMLITLLGKFMLSILSYIGGTP